MTEYLTIQLLLLLKLVTSAFCGAVIGYERKNRLKEAGIRTHMLVALGSALITIISIYGFADIIAQYGYTFDPSRIAAQIVTGVGFLGAGMIFVRKQAVSGLTTAAGIWATAGIGMAIGADMYFIGIAGTILVFVIQMVLHRNFKWLKIPITKQIAIHTANNKEAIFYVYKTLTDNNIEVIDAKLNKTETGLVNMELNIKLPLDFEPTALVDILCDIPHVKSIEI
ncbi:MAG: MgtC/SapB family protein [Eubacteriaceae bacterium]|nr:MgtC/SapB family protein [Eubacteriaceae bacterium]